MAIQSLDERLRTSGKRELREAEAALGAAALLFGHESDEFKRIVEVKQAVRKLREDFGWWQPGDEAHQKRAANEALYAEALQLVAEFERCERSAEERKG